MATIHSVKFILPTSIQQIYMEHEEDLSITLDDLKHQDFQQQHTDPVKKNIFALYLTSNSSQLNQNQHMQIVALDTQTFPRIPIRRISCSRCLSENVSCQFCSECKRENRVCCRGIACIYDFHEYFKSPYKEVYLKCKCTDKYFPSTQSFQIDWRLFYLFTQLGKVDKIRYNYYLSFVAGLLWVDVEQIDKQGQIKVIRRVFEEKYRNLPEFYQSGNIQESNLFHLTNLFREQVKKHLNYKQSWDISCLDEESEEIIQYFTKNTQLKNLQSNLTNQIKDSEKQFIQDYQIRSNLNCKNLEISEIQVDPKKFSNFSKEANIYCLFFYHNKQNKLFVTNSTFEKNIQRFGLKAFDIEQIPEKSSSNSIWFKDRKGDIFSIQGQTLSVFKYNLLSKKMNCIELRKHQFFEMFKSAESLVYVAQYDRVYYFNQQSLNLSRYFDLYRPDKEENEFSNCLSVHLPRPFIKSTRSFRSEYPLKATYILEPHSKNPNIQVPVLYILQFKSTFLPVPLRLSKIIHSSERNVEPEDIISTQEFEEKMENFDFSNSIITVFKKEKHSIVALLCKINQKLAIIQGKIIQNQLRATVQWSIHPISFANKSFNPILFFHQIPKDESSFLTPYSLDKFSFQKEKTSHINSNLKESRERKQNVSHKISLSSENVKLSSRKDHSKIYCLNDFNGSHSNNTSRFLVYSQSENCFSELVLSICEGRYTLKQFFLS